MADFKGMTRQVPVSFEIAIGSENVRVTFDREAMTPYLLSQMQTRLNDGDVMAVATMLSEIIMDWDVTLEGQPFPPTPENVGQLSVSALASLSRRIGDEAVPTSEEGNASSATSSSPVTSSLPTQVNLQNGPEPSPSANPSAVAPTR